MGGTEENSIGRGDACIYGHERVQAANLVDRIKQAVRANYGRCIGCPNAQCGVDRCSCLGQPVEAGAEYAWGAGATCVAEWGSITAATADIGDRWGES